MTMLAAIALVGIGSYLLRAVPLLLVDRIRLSPRAEELLGDAVLAAMTALLVATITHLAQSPPMPGVPPAAVWAGLAVGTIAAALRQSMGRVLLAGMAAYGATLLLTTVW